MARYIAEGDVYALFPQTGIERIHVSQIDELPRADVVPKSEVEKIFEELCGLVMSKTPMIIRPIFKDDWDFDGGFINGKRDAFIEALMIIAELKKKYTEDQT